MLRKLKKKYDTMTLLRHITFVFVYQNNELSATHLVYSCLSVNSVRKPLFGCQLQGDNKYCQEWTLFIMQIDSAKKTQ